MTAAGSSALPPSTAVEVALARRQSLADLLRRSAKRYPDKLAVADRTGARTYAELDEDASRIANALLAKGVRPGERIALLSRNSMDYARTIFGVARAGAVLVPINFMLGAQEVAYILEHSSAIGLIVEESLLPVAQEAAKASGTLRFRMVYADQPVEDWEPFASLLEHEDATEPAIPIGPDDPAQILYTSGTESRPKGAVLSHLALISQYASCIVDGGMESSDVELHALPLFHCAQQHCFLVPDIYLGATSHILPGPDPAAVLEAIERHKVTKFFAPPTVWISLLRHPDFDRRDLSSLRKGYYGASIMPVEVLREIGERLPNVRLWNFYGQTEMAPMAVLLRPEDQIRKAGAAGKPALNVETRIVDSDGNELPPGEIGTIYMKQGSDVFEYHNDPEKTKSARRGRFVTVGDLGYVDEDGFLFITGRKSELIISGGVNLYPAEIEGAIAEHEYVRDVGVIGKPDEDMGEIPIAFIELTEDAPAREEALKAIEEFLGRRLSRQQRPREIHVLDALPRDPNGKLYKRKLKAGFETDSKAAKAA